MQVYVATADLDTTLRRLLAYAPARPLLVTDIGRSDLLLGLAAANESVPGPHTAGVLVTNSEQGRREIGPQVKAVLEVGAPATIVTAHVVRDCFAMLDAQV